MKNLKITVNGTTYNVKVEEVSENSNKKASVQNDEKNTSTKNNVFFSETVKCPVSGTAVSVNVSEGQSVKKGDVLLAVESTSLKNEITSIKDDVISEVKVVKSEPMNSGSSSEYIQEESIHLN